MDRAAAMLHNGVVRYIPPSGCVSRDAEVASVHKNRDFLERQNHDLKQGAVFNADLGSEFKLPQAFTCQGIAL